MQTNKRGVGRLRRCHHHPQTIWDTQEKTCVLSVFWFNYLFIISFVNYLLFLAPKGEVPLFGNSGPFISYVLRNLFSIVAHLWKFVLLLASFLAFVVINGGIVIGKYRPPPKTQILQLANRIQCYCRWQDQSSAAFSCRAGVLFLRIFAGVAFPRSGMVPLQPARRYHKATSHQSHPRNRTSPHCRDCYHIPIHVHSPSPPPPSTIP